MEGLSPESSHNSDDMSITLDMGHSVFRESLTQAGIRADGTDFNETAAVQIIQHFVNSSASNFGYDHLLSFNDLVNDRLANAFDKFAIWKLRFGEHDLAVVVIRSHWIEKSASAENNGTSHAIDITEAVYRGLDLTADVFVWMDVWKFSRHDHSAPASTDLPGDGGVVIDWTQTEAYQAKLREGHEVCHLTPWEISNFKHLVMVEHHTRKRWMGLPVLTGSNACRVQDLQSIQDEGPIPRGFFMLSGRKFVPSRLSTLKPNHIFHCCQGPKEAQECFVFIRSKQLGAGTSARHTEMWLEHPTSAFMTSAMVSLRSKRRIPDTIPLHIVLTALGWTRGCNANRMAQFFVTLIVGELDITIRRMLQAVLASSAGGTPITQHEALVFIGSRTKTEELNRRNANAASSAAASVETSVASSSASATTGLRLAPSQPRVVLSSNDEELLRLGNGAVDRSLLPHVGVYAHCRDAKAAYLLRMLAQLILLQTGHLRPDNIHSQANKRSDSVGHQIEEGLQRHFAAHVVRSRRNMVSTLQHRSRIDLDAVFDAQRLSDDWRESMLAGDLQGRSVPAVVLSAYGKAADAARNTIQQANRRMDGSTGLIQPLDESSHVASLSCMTRESTHKSGNAAESISVEERHPNQGWGVHCVLQTPDGPGCGVVKHGTMLARFTTDNGASSTIESYVSSQVVTESAAKVIARFKSSTHATCEGSRCICWNPPIVEEPETLVMHNGQWLGVIPTQAAERAATRFRCHRTGLLPDSFPSVHHRRELEQLSFQSDQGRAIYPLLSVPKLPRLLQAVSSSDPRPLYQVLTDAMLIRGGYIEMLDKEEENDILVAADLPDLLRRQSAPFMLTFTHMEISSLACLSIASAVNPLINMGHGSRALLHASGVTPPSLAGSLQSLCSSMLAIKSCLSIPTRRLVYSQVSDLFRVDDMTPGQSVTVAIYAACNTTAGAVAVNSACVQRGFARSVQHVTVSAVEKCSNITSHGDVLGRPDTKHCTVLRALSVEHISQDGLPRPGAHIQTNDVIIGRLRRVAGKDPTRAELFEDRSVCVTSKRTGIVSRVVLTSNTEGERVAKVQVRRTKQLSEGDKLAAHAQKGVVSDIIPFEQMVFASNGQNVDVVFNPHGWKRLTEGFQMEMLMGNASLQVCSRIDGTPWMQRAYAKHLQIAELHSEELRATGACEGNPSMESMDAEEKVSLLAQVLHRRGFHRTGCARLMDPDTGRIIGGINNGPAAAKRGLIMTGPIDFHTLPQMATDRLHHRSTGPRHWVTRQPIAGGEKGGGYKLGPMETHSLASSGASAILRDRDACSDNHRMRVCCNCGEVLRGLTAAHESSISTQCPVCHSTETSVQVESRFYVEMFLNKLAPFNLYPRLNVTSASRRVRSQHPRSDDAHNGGTHAEADRSSLGHQTSSMEIA
jgi:DNA-directed RNA polymerase beta subunit